MKLNKITSVLIFLLSIISTINAKNLVNQVKVVNKPPFVANKNLIVASYPDSQIVITLNAIDPENQGVFAILKNKNIGDNIKCYVRNSIQIVCSIPNIPLSKSDTCSINTNEGIKNLPYCKEYNIQYYLKDNGYAGEPPAISPVYNIKLRVAKEVKLAMSNNSKLSAKDIDYRNYFYKLKGNYAVSSYNKETIANILPTNMKKQYEVALNTANKSNLLNNKIIGNSQAVANMKNAVSGTNTQYLISKANTITSGTAVTSAPIYCTIKRAGVVGASAYVCSLDPLLSISPALATKYSYDESNMASQKNALSQCETACKENVKCNDVSSNIYYTLIENKNYITSDIANQNQTDKTYSVKSLKIVERDSNGNLIGNIEIPISNATLNDFYWIINNKMNTTHNVGGIELNCGFRSNLDIKTYIQDNSFYVEPQQTCYIKQGNLEYPRVNDSTLYTFKLLYYQPQFTCPVSGVHIVYKDRKTCENNCIYQGQCLTIRNPLAKIDEHIVNNCKDTTLINGEKLSDAVAKGQCKLVDEVSLDSQGNVEKYFVKNGAVVDPLRDNIGFSESPSILKKENAIEMLGSFLDMNRKGKDDQRVSYIDINNTLIGFNNKPVTNRNWDALTSIYDVKDYNASASILLKISPSLIKDIENEKLDASDYAILPIFMVVNKQDYGEKQTYLKTYYLLNLNDFNNTKEKIVSYANLEGHTKYTNPIPLGNKCSSYRVGCASYAFSWSESGKQIIANVINKYGAPVKVYWNGQYKGKLYNANNITAYHDQCDGFGFSTKKVTCTRNVWFQQCTIDNNSPGFTLGCFSGKCDRGSILSLCVAQTCDPVKVVTYGGVGCEDHPCVGYYCKNTDYVGCPNGYHKVILENGNLACAATVWSCPTNYKRVGNVCLKTYENPIIHISRILNEFLFLKRDALIFKKDNSIINPNNLLFKLSNGKWGITYQAYMNNITSIVNWKLKVSIINPDYFLEDFGKNTLLSKRFYFSLPYKASIVGVTTFDKVKQSYNQFLKDEKNYPPKERNFNTYKIEMDNSYVVKTINVSSITYIPGFNKISNINGLFPIEQEFGKNYNPNNLQIGSLINKWELDPKKIDINAYVKDINLWKYLRRGDTLLPQWLAKINFDSFEDGKLFLIFDKKKNIETIINNIKEKGFDYLTKLLENDFNGNKKYLAWDMDNRYTNSIIYNGNNTYRGLESTNVNRFINYFGLTSYDTLCPENFYFNGHVCVYSKDSSLLATAFPDYFTNQLEDKNGPLYAAYNRDTLLVRMVPKTGIKPFETDIVCPKGYSYDKYLKECVKHANLKDCTAPNGSYDFEHQVCIAEATCSNGGFFDSTLGKCIKLSPANYTGENGYYFIFEQDKNAYDMFTPLATPSKYTCYFDEYKCPLNGSIFNSKDTCDLMCFNVVNGKRIYGDCQKVAKIKKDSYNDEQTCNFQCAEIKNSFNWYGNLIIKGNSIFNKYSNVSVYHNGSLVSNGNVIDNKFSFGNGSLIVKDVKPGDEVKIVISSKWTGLQYANGLAYWNDAVGAQTKTVGDKKCFLLNKYYTPQNEITIGLDVDGDNYSDSQVQIPTFYCLSNNPFEKTITIKVLGTGLDVNYYDTFLNNKDKKATLSFRDKGICVASSDKSQNTLVPFFETMISNDFINNVSVSTLHRYFPPYSYHGIKDNNIDKEKVLAFKKHFCYYPLQQEYDLIKNYSFVNNISDLFNLYKYYDSCPSYFDGNVKMLRLSNDANKRAVYKLGVERISKNLLDLNIYNPLQIYNAINKYHIVTLPSGKGVYMEDNYFIKIPHIGRGRKIWIGYGYSPFKDCVSIDGQSVKTNTVYAPMTNCNFVFGSWTYDSSIKKCISNPTSNGCMFGELVNGKCELNPICPEGYIPDGSGRCEKIIVQTYQTNRKICKPWWTLRRKYICNGINGIGSYMFGLPRWITIEKVPVYRYEEYNFNNN